VFDDLLNLPHVDWADIEGTVTTKPNRVKAPRHIRPRKHRSTHRR
jgi:beta-lactamase class C